MCTVINKVGGQASGSRHVGNVRKVIEDQEPDVAMSLIDDEDRLRSDSEPVGVARRPTDSDAGDRLDGVARLRAQQRKEVCHRPAPPTHMCCHPQLLARPILLAFYLHASAL
jgi:hypothetical protein